MTGLLVGVLAFGIASLVDVAALRSWRWAKPPILVVCTLLFGFAIFDVSFRTPQFVLPFPAWLAGLVLLPLAGLLFIYSEFVEIPLAIYWQANSTPRLLNTGTYALCRHPGALWFGLLLASLILVSRSIKLLVAAPIWLAIEILWVWGQDRYLFPRLITGYRDYQRETPMLWPSRRSVKACVSTSLARLRRRSILHSEGG